MINSHSRQQSILCQNSTAMTDVILENQLVSYNHLQSKPGRLPAD